MTLYLGPSSVSVTSALAIGGFLGISVPVGYDSKRVPIGICSGKLKGSKPKLIEIAYCFKQANKIRKPPSFEPSGRLEGRPMIQQGPIPKRSKA